MLFYRCRYRDGKNDTSKQSKLVQVITKCLQDHFGGQWRFPSNDGKTVERKALSNPRARKTIRGLRDVVDIAFSEEYDEAGRSPKAVRAKNEKLRKNWQSLLEIYIPLMEQLRQHEDFTPEQIRSFHKRCNTFMDHWVTTSKKGILCNDTYFG